MVTWDASDQPHIHRARDRPGATRDPKLFKHVQQMGLHRRLPDEQLLGDRRVTEPGSHQSQNLSLYVVKTSTRGAAEPWDWA